MSRSLRGIHRIPNRPNGFDRYPSNPGHLRMSQLAEFAAGMQDYFSPAILDDVWSFARATDSLISMQEKGSPIKGRVNSKNSSPKKTLRAFAVSNRSLPGNLASISIYNRVRDIDRWIARSLTRTSHPFGSRQYEQYIRQCPWPMWASFS